jgi:hypothetical protein
MAPIRRGWTRTASLLSLVLATAASAHAQNALLSALPDATLYTTYNLTAGNQGVNWIVCGSVQQSNGCYASGSVGPFEAVGALLEGSPVIQQNKVTRAIYVLDAGSANNVRLFVYKKTDTVTSQTDVVTVTLTNTITLPLVGGADVSSSMAANAGFLFIGTDQSPNGVRVRKFDLSVSPLPGFSPPINVTAVTADKYGYVTVTQGNFSAGSSGFYLYGPDGSLQEDGGGAEFMLDTTQAVLPSKLP